MNRLLSVGLLRSAVFASLALSLIACFLFYESQDEKIPYGSHSFVSITGIDDGLSKTEATDVIMQTVRDFKVNLTKVTVDPESVNGDRLLIAFVGDERAFHQNWPDGDYPSFSGSLETRVAYPRDLGITDLRGGYASDAAEVRLAAVASALTQAGVLTQIEHVSTAQLFSSMIGSPLMPALFGMLAALVVVIAYSVTHRQKIYAIKGLHGQADVRILVHEIGRLAADFGASIAVLGAIGIAFLGFYNQFHQAGPFLGLVLQVLGIHGAILISIQLFAFVGSRTDDIVGVIKGRRPLRNLAVFSVIAQSISFILVFLVASITVQLVADTRSDREFAAKWQAASDYVTVSFTARTEEEFQSAMPRFGNVVRDSDTEGTVVLAYQPPVPIGQSEGYGPYNGNSLVVNSRYLREQTVLGNKGERILPDEVHAGQILLLVPEQLESQLGAITSEYLAWAQFEREIGDSASDSYSDIDVSTVVTESGQELFNYGGTFARPQISQQDPVVAVVSMTPGMLSDSFLISAASTGNILFADPENLNQQITTSELDIASVDRASDRALAHLAERDAALRAYLLVVGFALLVLLFSTSILTSVYCDRFKQTIFQKFVHGFPFLRTHGAFLGTSLVWSAVLIVVSMTVTGLNSEFAFPVSAIVIVVNLVCGVAFALLFQRRFRGDFIKRY